MVHVTMISTRGTRVSGTDGWHLLERVVCRLWPERGGAVERRERLRARPVHEGDGVCAGLVQLRGAVPVTREHPQDAAPAMTVASDMAPSAAPPPSSEAPAT